MGAAMVAIDRFILLVRGVRHSESGIAVPTALMALLATFGLASVAVFSTVNVQQGTARDHDSKEAIAAADAGASIAMLRLNRYLPSLNAMTAPCIGPTGLTQIPSEGWCPKSSPPEKVGNAEFSYQVSAFGTSKQIEVIAWGSSGGVTRRVNVGMQAIDGKNIFADEKVIGEEGIEFSGAAAEIYTSLGTNGEIINSGNSSPTLCGNGRHGVGKGKVPPLSCGGVESEGEMTLPPVVPPVNVGADNCRLWWIVTSPCTTIDNYVAKNNASRNATRPWSPTPKVLDLDNNAALTLGGRNYLVCQLIVDGGKLYMPFNTEVNIYIDTPQNCGLAPGTVQLAVTNNGEILSSAYNPPQGSYAIPNFYLLGEGKVSLQGNPSNIDPKNGIVSNEMMIYGPQATVEFSGNSSWKGMVAAKKVYINGHVTIESSSKFKLPEKNLAPIFQRTRYVECSAATGTTPNANC